MLDHAVSYGTMPIVGYRLIHWGTWFNNREKRGYEKFKENACATCHTGVILDGRSFEYLDIYGDYFADRTNEIAYNSDDDGLKGFTGKDEDLHKFKVPGPRNIALTAPYFHDGTFQTLEDAVRAMARYELGKDLSDQDVCSIVAFSIQQAPVLL